MTLHESPSRQEILADFHRRRTRALLTLIPFLGGFAVLMSAGDLDFNLAGLSSEQRVLAGFALIGLGVVAYVAVWRCPVCRAGFSRGFSVPLCPKCGTVFSEPSDEPTADPAGARREHLERALASELKKYRSERGVFRTKGVLAIVLGLVAAIFLPLASDSAPTSGWLYQTFGDRAPLAGGIAIGGFLILVGVLIVVFQTRSINAGARRHEQHLRERMGLPATSPET